MSKNKNQSPKDLNFGSSQDLWDDTRDSMHDILNYEFLLFFIVVFKQKITKKNV